MQDFEQSGGCQCGQVRYTLTQIPQVIYCCHCTECQKQSASAFGISVRVKGDALKITGKLSTISMGGADRQFCPDCGTRLFHRRPGYRDQINIKGGSFDGTSWIMPAGHIWTGSKQSWVLLAPDAITYEGQPENYDALIAAYGFSAPK